MQEINFKPVRLFVNIFGESCEMYFSRNNDFFKKSCSSGTSDVFLDGQFSQSPYNSYHVFGIQDSRNRRQYRFIDVKQNKYLRLSSRSLPLISNSTDSRLFSLEKIIQSNTWSLRHVASQKYISVNSSNNKIILVNNKESALEVDIVEQ